MLYQNWPAVITALQGLDWLRLVFSLLELLLVLPMMASISWVCLRSLGANLPVRQVFSLYFITQLPKYLPGGVWAFPGRMVAYRLSGLSDAYAILSVFREVAALFLGAVMVGAIAVLSPTVGGGQGADGIEQWPVASWAGAAKAAQANAWLVILLVILACLGGILLTHSPAFWQFLKRRFAAAGSGAAPQSDDLTRYRSPHRSPFLSRRLQAALFAAGDSKVLTSLTWLPGALLCSLLFWLAMGIPFAQLAAALLPGREPLSWLQAASLFALSWSIGFVVVIAPAGFGVRESALVLLLAPFLPPAVAASLALLSRLWWMAVEALLIGVSIWLIGDPRRWLGKASPKAS